MVEKQTKPRIGGVFLCVCVLTMSDLVACGFVAVLLLGWLDDLLDLSPWTKLVVETSVGWVVSQDYLATLWIVFFMNAMNLSDNMDGLAGGLGIIAAIFLGQPILAGVLAMFLVFNFPTAKIYLGDCGSLALGYMLAILVLENPSTNIYYVAVPITDTIYVMISRTWRGRSIFRGGRDHLSHKLTEFMSKRWAVVTLWGVAVGTGLGL